MSLRPGKHEGLISLEDFPLRGFILCDDCSKPLTACWSKGKTQRYPYYLCPTRGCPSYRKSIPRADLEGEFESLLIRLRSTRTLVDLARAMFRSAWEIQQEKATAAARALQASLVQIDRQIESLLDRIVDASQPSVVAAYEKRIAKLERDEGPDGGAGGQNGAAAAYLRGVVRTRAAFPVKPLEYLEKW